MTGRKGLWQPRRLAVVLGVFLLATGAACRGESQAEKDTPALEEAVRDLVRRGGAFEFSVDVDDARSGPQVLSGTGVMSEGRVSLRVDGTEAPNAAGFWGHYDRFEAVFDGTSSYFKVVPGDNWLLVTLEAGGSLAGKNIARLRDLLVINPLLILQQLEGHLDEAVVGDDGRGFEFTLVTRGDVSEETEVLRRAYGVDEFEVRLVVDEDGQLTELGIDLIYELVRNSSAVVAVGGTLRFSGPAQEVSLPPEDAVTTL